ncbi:FeoB-associated Cys-rich membrane protein [Clostridium sp.]|nr:FeoB-associated Cys-rich membrane protein [uncultured Clostridium sp.]
MWVEISITLFIIAIAGHIIYHSLKSKGSGDCGCGNCSSKKKSN